MKTMPKRPSLFAPKPASDSRTEDTAPDLAMAESRPVAARPPSRVGKRVLSIYLNPVAWRQLRELALDLETSTQALGEEAVNLLFEKHRRNRSA
jgi:Antitoxin-like ribbon-helix-helix